MAVQRIGILTSGGDAPGMNAAIRAATLVARAQGVDVAGIERGDRGLLDGAFVPLAPATSPSSGADPRLGALQGVPPPRGLRPGARGAGGPRDRPRPDGSPGGAGAAPWLVDLGAVLALTDRLRQGQSPLARWRAGEFAEIEDALLL